MVDDLFGLIDHLNLGRVFLVGLSFGSTITLRALQREPRRFPKAVVQGAFAWRKSSSAERLALILGRRIPGTSTRLPLRRTVLSYNGRSEFPSVIADRWPYYLEQNGLTPIAAMAHRIHLLTRLDLRPLLPEISTEILLLQGNEDRIVPRRFFDELNPPPGCPGPPRASSCPWCGPPAALHACRGARPGDRRPWLRPQALARRPAPSRRADR